MDLPKVLECPRQKGMAVSQIGAEGDAGTHEGLFEWKALMQAQDILHVVEPGLVLSGITSPEGSSERSAGEGLPT